MYRKLNCPSFVDLEKLWHKKFAEYANLIKKTKMFGFVKKKKNKKIKKKMNTAIVKKNDRKL